MRNLPLMSAVALPAAFRVADPEGLLELLVSDAPGSPDLLPPALPPMHSDWPDALAAALRLDPSLQLRRWAAAQGLAPATLSRGFSATFGITPARYRADLRLFLALQALARRDAQPLAQLAHGHGFADQAHLSRAVRAATGLSPTQLRRSNLFKTEAAGRP